MSKPIKVAEVSELKPGQGKVVTVGEKELALFNIEGRFYAVDNICPHRGGPLGEGMLEGSVVTCPWHGWKFDVTTGISPVVKTAKVERVEVVVEGNDVKVRLNGD